jgi:hypothetical protein
MMCYNVSETLLTISCLVTELNQIYGAGFSVSMKHICLSMFLMVYGYNKFHESLV